MKMWNLIQQIRRVLHDWNLVFHLTKISRAYKFRIYPNNEQKRKLAQNFGCARFVFNYFLFFQKENYEKGGKYISYNTLAK